MLVALCAGAFPAHAQVAYKEAPIDPVAVAMMSGFARCVADTDPTGARRALAADYRSPTYYPYIRSFAIAHKSCLGRGQLRFRQVLLAGGMAEELTRKAGLTISRLTAAAASGEDSTSPERCLVRQQPNAVMALFATAPASRREEEAIEALRPGYEACLPADRAPVYNKLSMRALLALAVYRLTNDAPMAPPKG